MTQNSRVVLEQAERAVAGRRDVAVLIAEQEQAIVLERQCVRYRRLASARYPGVAHRLRHRNHGTVSRGLVLGADLAGVGVSRSHTHARSVYATSREPERRFGEAAGLLIRW